MPTSDQIVENRKKRAEALFEARENNEREEKALKSLDRNGIKNVQYNRGGTVYQYILDPRDTEHGAGKFLWGLLDFLMKHRDFIMLSKADFEGKVKESKRAVNIQA